MQLLLEYCAAVDAQNKDGDRPVHAASWADDVDVLRLLVEAGAQVDAGGWRGERALAVAAMRGQLRAARFLCIEADASVGVSDDIGVSPLCAALRHGAPRGVSKLLRDEGAVLTPQKDCADAALPSRDRSRPPLTQGEGGRQ